MRNHEVSERMVGRYRFLARGYDALSGEPVYRVGRRVAVDALGLRPGDSVLDLGCGTGLNLPLLRDRVGPSGRVLALDLSPVMLGRAAARVRRAGWDNVTLVEADATRLDPDRLARPPDGFDAVLATYALSLMPDWPRAWRSMVAAAAPGGRLGVVDTRLPVGRARPAAPAARLACALGGADVDAHPWTALEAECGQVHAWSGWGGHVQVRVGRREPPGR